MEHELKTWPQYFRHVVDGSKTFELRKDDRGFRQGDIVLLREWDPDEEEYTGREATARIGYILEDHCAALPTFDGHVIFSLHDVAVHSG